MSPEFTTRVCPYCKEEIKADAVLCMHCRSALAPEKPSHEGTCPYCKESIHPEAVKCKHCGSAVGPTRSGCWCGCGCGCGHGKGGHHAHHHHHPHGIGHAMAASTHPGAASHFPHGTADLGVPDAGCGPCTNGWKLCWVILRNPDGTIGSAIYVYVPCSLGPIFWPSPGGGIFS